MFDEIFNSNPTYDVGETQDLLRIRGEKKERVVRSKLNQLMLQIHNSSNNIKPHVSENCGKHAIKYLYLQDLIFYLNDENCLLCSFCSIARGFYGNFSHQ